ncbi:MAG: hypothetical protein D6692_02500 [Planctomycetota bacterium]|nr:MAG: hypothetical protein D6692_02500 [Planctomycetota bacterium]
MVWVKGSWVTVQAAAIWSGGQVEMCGVAQPAMRRMSKRGMNHGDTEGTEGVEVCFILGVGGVMVFSRRARGFLRR